MLAGETGMLLGGLSGSRRRTQGSTVNEYTFLILYKWGRPRETEKVRDDTARFRFLVSKLDVDGKSGG